MRLLVVSHPCVTPINQQFYADVERQTGWDVTLVVPQAWRDGYGRVRTADRWPAFGGQILTVPVWRSGSVPLHAYRSTFAGVFRDVDPDAVYVHHEPYAVATAQVYAAHRAAGRGPIGFYSAQNIAKAYPPPFRWTERAVFRQSAFAFPVSATVEGVLRTKGYAGASVPLALGVDGAVYRPPSAADRAATRTRLGAGEADLLLGYLGRVTEAKGLRTLAHALAGLGDLSWRLAVVGAGPFENGWDALAADLGIGDRIVRTGYVPHTEAPGYLGALDALVVPSETQPGWKEQFGRVVVESMACGTAVVGSDSGEIPVLLERTGGGLVFPEGDAHALAAQIRRIAEDPSLRVRLAEAGGAAVRRDFSLNRVVTTFAETVEDAVARYRS